MAREGMGLGGVLWRIAVAMALVLLTYNPSGFSYHHWVFGGGGLGKGGFDASKAFLGALLLCSWVVYLRAAIASLGWLGVLLSGLVIASAVWLLAQQGWLDPSRPKTAAWIALVALGLVLGVGLGWSNWRRRLTGQVDVDELDR